MLCYIVFTFFLNIVVSVPHAGVISKYSEINPLASLIAENLGSTQSADLLRKEYTDKHFNDFIRSQPGYMSPVPTQIDNLHSRIVNEKSNFEIPNHNKQPNVENEKLILSKEKTVINNVPENYNVHQTDGTVENPILSQIRVDESRLVPNNLRNSLPGNIRILPERKPRIDNDFRRVELQNSPLNIAQETKLIAEETNRGHPIYRTIRNYQLPSLQKIQNVDHITSDQRVRDILLSTKHKKRYLVIHPNGTVEHLESLDNIVKEHPNYVLVNARDIVPSNKKAEVSTEYVTKPLQPTSVTEDFITPDIKEIDLNSKSSNLGINDNIPSKQLPSTLNDQNHEVSQLANSPDVIVASITTENSIDNTPILVTEKEISFNPITTEIINVVTTDVPDVVFKSVGNKVVNIEELPKESIVTFEANMRPMTTGVPDVVFKSIGHDVVNIEELPKESIETFEANIRPVTTGMPDVVFKSIGHDVVNIEELPKESTETFEANIRPVTTGMPDVVFKSIGHDVVNIEELPKESTETFEENIRPVTTGVPDIVFKNIGHDVVNNEELPKQSTETFEANIGPVTTGVPDVVFKSIRRDVVNNEELPKQSTDTFEASIRSDEEKESVTIEDSNDNSNHKPFTWFRTDDEDFWDKLSDGKDDLDVVYFFYVKPHQRVETDTIRTIHPNGTIVEEYIESVWKNEYDTEPIVTKTVNVIQPEDCNETPEIKIE